MARRILLGWLSVYVMAMAWAPVAWFVHTHRIGGSYDFLSQPGWSQAACAALVVHALAIMVLYGKLAAAHR